MREPSDEEVKRWHMQQEQEKTNHSLRVEGAILAFQYLNLGYSDLIDKIITQMEKEKKK